MATRQVDPRFNLVRPDLIGDSPPTPVDYTVGVDQTPLYNAAPPPTGKLDDILLRGELFSVSSHDKNGWSWGQTRADHYVGYVRTADLVRVDTTKNYTTQVITAPSSHLYTHPDIKSPVTGKLFMGSPLRVTGKDSNSFVQTESGYVPRQHFQTQSHDFVVVAQRFKDVPYLWGGRSIIGIDCSGLVQMALRMTGTNAPRDSDLQAHLGIDVTTAPRQRGDLVCWKGHIGIMTSDSDLLHANAHHMSVQTETLDTAQRRIAPQYGNVTTIRRLSTKQG